MNRKERRQLERQKIYVDEVKTDEIKPKKSYKKQAILTVIFLVVIGAIFFSYSTGKEPGEYDGFVACLAENGVKFYGSFQCSHCQEQKKDFGKSSKLLDSSGVYVECGALGSFNSLCTSNGVKSVPHWVINGETVLGRQPLANIAENSGCSLPNETS